MEFLNFFSVNICREFYSTMFGIEIGENKPESHRCDNRTSTLSTRALKKKRIKVLQ